MKIVKDYDVRKQEILDTSYRLFEEKGYDQTKIIDITTNVGIAKGTFYHYFGCKEEVLDAIVKGIVDDILAHARDISNNQLLSVHDKLGLLLGNTGYREEEPSTHKHIEKSIHEIGDASIHINSIVRMIKELSLVLSDVIEEGIAQGVFATKYPTMVSDLILSAASVLFDHQFAIYQEEERVEKIGMFVELIEILLGLHKGELGYITRTFEEESE